MTIWCAECAKRSRALLARMGSSNGAMTGDRLLAGAGGRDDRGGGAVSLCFPPGNMATRGSAVQLTHVAKTGRDGVRRSVTGERRPERAW